jgi:3-oxoacyl-[acyl-carrier protein] reductase
MTRSDVLHDPAGELTGRRALVTGASGGIGGALAVRLAGAGADLVLTWSGHREEVETAAARVRELGRTAAVLRSDLSEPGAGRALAARVTAEVGPVDVLVANAGLGRRTAWDEVDDDMWERTFAVNVTAPWQLSSALLPGMVERRFGRVLYVSSVAAVNGGVVGPHYAASKAALHGLMHHLAPRVAGSGVTVNTIAPALISGTRMLPGGDGGELPMPVPVGRLGRPDDVARLAVAMLSNAYLTDKVVLVDGGLYPA